jgi:hypothetical protein
VKGKKACILIIIVQEWLRRKEICLTLGQTLLPAQSKLVLPGLFNFPSLDADVVCGRLHELEQEGRDCPN